MRLRVGVSEQGPSLQEGKQASLAADLSITQFRHLGRLLMVHGRSSYKRSAALGQFVMHRGLIISTMQVLRDASPGSGGIVGRELQGGGRVDLTLLSLQGRVLLRLLLRLGPSVPGIPHGGVSRLPPRPPAPFSSPQGGPDLCWEPRWIGDIV